MRLPRGSAEVLRELATSRCASDAVPSELLPSGPAPPPSRLWLRCPCQRIVAGGSSSTEPCVAQASRRYGRSATVPPLHHRLTSVPPGQISFGRRFAVGCSTPFVTPDAE